MEYYICDYGTQKALYGPLESKQVVEFINTCDTPKKYCNMSRYMLAKNGIYPDNKSGNQALRADLLNSPIKTICQHNEVDIYSRMISMATLWEPAEYDVRYQCHICGEELDEIPRGARENSFSWDAWESEE